MLRLCASRIPARSRILVLWWSPAKRYHSAEADQSLDTKYESITDYLSYKNSLFTHRLPETTAQQSPPLTALHKRLRLPELYTLSTLSQALNLDKYGGLAGNFGLNTLGKNFLLYYVAEYLLMKYPRLPMAVHNAAVDAYMGTEVLAEIGKSWGIEIDKTSKLQKSLSKEPETLQFGKLRFILDDFKEKTQEAGIYELTAEEAQSFDHFTQTYVSLEQNAYAAAVRSIIGGYYTHVGEEATRKFIQQHILSRKIPLAEMFQFSKPTRELDRVCEKLGLDAPLEIRLVAETGRLSAHAIYVAAAFCGGDKLGEGVGSSLNEAKTRAVVNALLAYYLYSPISKEGSEVKLPSDENYEFEGIVGLGDVAI